MKRHRRNIIGSSKFHSRFNSKSIEQDVRLQSYEPPAPSRRSRLLKRTNSIAVRIDWKQRRYKAHRDMRPESAEVFSQFGERVILFTVNQDKLDKREGLAIDRPDRPLDPLQRPAHRHKDRDHAVGSRSAASDEAAAI